MRAKLVKGALASLAAFCVSVNSPSYGQEKWSIHSSAELVKFSTQGTKIYGHQFGAIFRKDDCQQALLALTLSTLNPGVANQKGTTATFLVSTGKTTFYIDVPLVSVEKIFEPTYALVFSNFAMNQNFTDELNNSRYVSFELVKPSSLREALDITTETFQLKDFDSTRKQAIDVCLN